MKKEVMILLAVIVIVSGLVYGLIRLTDEAKMQEAKETDKNVNLEEQEQTPEATDSEIESIDFLAKAEEMKATPNAGEVIATISVKNYGDIKIKFFEDAAPNAVENFVTHSKNGYYNGLTFHRVIDDFMIQGGDPKGDGTGGESIWGEPFGKEVSAEYFPFRGTLAMASRANVDKSLGSQFFITQAGFESLDSTLQLSMQESLPKNLFDAYKVNGGYPSLYGEYTVFGMVYEGMDIVDKIAETKVDSADKPETPVVIEKIEITEAN